MNLLSGFSDITPDELVQYLLDESGQANRDAVNPADILEYLHLVHYTANLCSIISSEMRSPGSQPRALLSFSDRLVVTDSEMIDARARFSVLHEIGHYLLPDHRYSMYLCDDEGLGYQSRFQFEREANEFAAKLLFNGNRFRLDANSIPLSAKTVESLAKKYRASFEATARRLVEYSFRPCMLIVFMQEQTHDRVNINTLGKWRVRYCIPSSQFSRHYFSRLEGTFSGDKYDEMSRPGHSIAESLIEEVQIETRDGEKRPFMAECFSNTYNIFCFLQPLQKQVLKGT